MAPKMTPVPQPMVASTTQHNLKLITAVIIIGILLVESQQTFAQDMDATSILPHHYNDNENSIYYDEEDNSSSSTITNSNSFGTTNSSGTSNIQMPKIFSCPAEGLYAHNYECQLYYRCESQINGHIKAYLLSCKKGTIFSRDLKLCMPAMLANREECQQYINEIDTLTSDSDDDGFFVGAGNTEGAKVGVQNDDVINTTIDENIDSRLIHILNAAKIKSGIANNGNAMDSVYNHWQNYGLTGLSGVSVISFSTSSARSAGLDSISSSTDNDQGPPCKDDGFISDPDNCTVFYRCISNGHTFNKIGFRCSDGTAWDELLQSCNHLFNVRANGGCQGKQDIQMNEYNSEQASTQSSQSYHQNNTSSSISQQSSTSSDSSSSHSTSSSMTSLSQQSASQSNSTESSSSSSSQISSSSTSSNSQQSSSSSNQENSTQSSSSINLNNNSNSQNNSSNQDLNNEDNQQISSNNQQSSSNSNATTGSSNSSSQNSNSNSQNSNNQSSNSQNSSNNINQQTSNSQNSSIQGANQNSSMSNPQNNNNQQSFSVSNNNQHSTNSPNSQSSNSNSQNNNNNDQQQISSNSNSTTSFNQTSNSESHKPSPTDCIDENTYLADKENCAKFYRCRNNGNSDLEVVPFSCGPGTVWNQANKVCDLPTDLQREKCNIFTSSSTENQTSSSTSNNQSNSSNSLNNQSGSSSNNNNHSGSSNNQTGSSSNNDQSSSSNNQSGSSSSHNQSGSSSNNSNQSISSNNHSNSSSSNNQSELSSNNNNQSSSSNNQSISSSSSTNQSESSSNNNNQSVSSNNQSTSSSSSSNQNNQSNQSQSSSNNQSSDNNEGQQQIKPQKPSNPDGECKDIETYLQDKYDCARFYRCVNNDNGGFDTIPFDCAPSTVWDPNSKGCNHPTDIQKEQCRIMATNDGLESSSTSSSTSGNSSSQNQESSSSSGFNQSSSNNQGSNSSNSSNNNQSASSSASDNQNHNSNNNIQNSLANNQSSSPSNNQIQGSNNQTSSSSSNNSIQSSSTAQSGSQQSTTMATESNQSSSSNNQSENSSSSSSSSNNNQSGSSNQSTSSNNQNQGSNQGSSSSSSSSNNNNNQSQSGNTQNSTSSSNIDQSISSNSSTSNTSISSSSTSNHQGSSTTSSISPSNSYQTNTTQKPFKPATQCESEETFLDDKEDCNKFYRCIDNGKGGYNKVSFKCPPGTVWHPSANSCDHLAQVQNLNCKMISNSLQNATGSNNQESSSSSSGSSESSGSESSSSSSSNNNLGSSSSSNNESSSSNSSSSSSGSSTSEENNSNQSSNQGSTSSSSQSQSTTNNQSSSSILSSTQGSNTNQSFSSTTTQESNTSQSISQGSFSNTTQSSSSSQQSSSQDFGSSSSQQNPVGICKENNQYLEDSKHCAKFYRCVKNSKDSYDKVSFTCGPGTVWDSQIKGCNHVWAVKNKNCGSGSDAGSETQTPTQQITEKPTTQRPSSTLHTTNKPTEQKPTQKPSPQKPVTSRPTSTQISTMEEATTLKPSAHIICKAEGFTGDPNDCSRFYRCVDNGNGRYIQYSFRCGQGTVWDNELQTCNHDLNKCNPIIGEHSSTQNPQGTTTSKPGYLPSSQKPQITTTNKPEYQPTTGSNSETTTGKPGYKPTTQRPQQTTTTKPGYQPTTEMPQATSTLKPQPTTESGKYPETTTEIKTTTIKPTPNEPISSSDKCSKKGFYGDKEDCQKFYRCIDNGKGNFEKHSFKCGNNTIWDKRIETCNHPEDVAESKCRIEPASGVQTTTESYVTTTTSKYDTTTVTGKPTTTYEPTTVNMESMPIGDLTTTVQPTSTTPIPNLPPGTNCQGEGFMADPNNCQKFYRCIKTNESYEKHEFKCAKNTAWNEKTQTCDHRKNIERCEGQTEEPETETTTMEYQSTTTEKYYFTTIISTTETTVNPTTTTYRPPTTYPSLSSEPTNYTTTIPTIPTSTTPIPNLPPGTKCKDEGFMPDPNNCRKFYRCEKSNNGYSKHEFMCAKGTGWNEEKQTCDHRDNIERCQGQTEQPDQEATTTGYTTSGPTFTPSTTTALYETTTTIPQKPTTTVLPITPTTSDQPTSTTPVPNLPPGTICHGEGFMADPYNCGKFYRCQKSGNGYSKHEFMCAKGTGWSEEKQTCDHRDNINRCQGQTEQPELETTTIYYTTNRPTMVNETTTNSYIETITATGFNESTSTTTSHETTTVVTQKPTTTSYPSTTLQPTKPTIIESSTTTDYTTTMQPTSTTPVHNLLPGKNCSGEGFMADPDNCRKFYRCEKRENGYSKHEFMCAKGTGWNEKKQTCDHRNNVDRCQNQMEGQDVETTTMEYITTKPITTSSELNTTTEYEKPSTTTISYDSTTINTGKPIIITQIPTTTSMPITKPTTEFSTTTDFATTTIDHTTTIQPMSTTPVPNLPPGRKCQSEGFMADPDNCRKFYRCIINGNILEQHEFMCGKGTGWSEDKQTCDHADVIERCKTQIEGIENTTIGYDTAPTVTTIVTTTFMPIENTTISIAIPTTTEFLPTDSSTTTKYPITTTQITDKPGYVPTTTDSSTNTESSTTVPTTTAESLEISTTITTEQYESTTVEPINHNCTEEGFFPDTNNCNRYYRCVDADKNGNYQVYSFHCPKDTAWDISLETCNYVDKISGNCSSNTTTTENPEETTIMVKPEITTTKKPYVTTTTGKPQPTTTKNPKETTTTNKPEPSTTENSKETTTTEVLQPTTIGNPQDTTTEKHFETTTLEPITGQTTTQPKPASNTSTPCPTTGQDQNLYICPTGFRRHPKHCNMFYQCTEKTDSYDHSIVVFECPKDTVYHENLNRCDAPKSSEICEIKSRTQTSLFEYEYKHSHMIQIHSTAPLCPIEGHFALNNDECGQLFVKCQYSIQTQRLEGYIFRCPEGFTYWSVSRRCERTQKLQNCFTTKYNVPTLIPVEWSNIGNKRRNLRL